MANRTTSATSVSPADLQARWSVRSICSSSDMANAKSVEEMERWEAGIEYQLKELDAVLEEQLKSRRSVDRGQQQLLQEILPSSLAPLISDATRLERSLDEASAVAEKVSRRVRQIDVVRTKTVEASQRTNDVLELRQCVTGVQAALKSENYEEAVKYMATYLKKFSQRPSPSFSTSTGAHAPSLGSSAASSSTTSQLLHLAGADIETRRIMRACEDQLLTALRQKLNTAISENNISSMTHFTQLFSPLGLHDEGIAHYASYLEKQINTDLEAIMTQVESSTKAAASKNTGEVASYAAALSQLIQRAHQRLKKAKSILEQAFGPSGLLHTVLILHPTLTARCTTLLDDFMRSWKSMEPQNRILKATRAAIAERQSQYLSLGASAPLPPWNPMEFAPLLDQIVIIGQTIEVNSRFTFAVIAQAKDALAKQIAAQPPASPGYNHSHTPRAPRAAPTPKEDADTIPSTLTPSSLQSTAAEEHTLSTSRTSFTDKERYEQAKQKIEAHSKQLQSATQLGPLSERLIELLGYYMRFEEFYMNRSIDAIITLDSTTEESRSPSLVDDVFFILKEASNRARATYNANTLCAVINYIDTELNSTFFNLLQERSSREALQQARSANALTSTQHFTGAQTPSAMNVLVAINQLEVTAGYIGRLKIDLEEPSKKIFALVPHELEKVLTCCEELQRTESKYCQLIQQQHEQVFEALKPRIEGILESVASVNYHLSSAEYAANQINDPFAMQVVHRMSEILGPIEQVLTLTNSSVLSIFVMRFLVRYLERSAIKKQFSQLGAEQLDSDIRTFIDYFSSRIPKQTVRESFNRISQIAFLLGVFSTEEVQEEWNARQRSKKESDKSAWALSPTDAKRILVLRADFTKDKIAALNLL